MEDRDRIERGPPSMPGELVFQSAFPAAAESVPEVRRMVMERLQILGADDITQENVNLALSEACTNAVIHAYPHHRLTGSFEVRAVRQNGVLHVVVTDEGVGMRPRADSPGLGYGLPLIASVAQHTEVVTGDAGGTVVDMTFTFRTNGALH
jgi:serine/threonine-protein kinase RsbW